jgi:tRNA modification GTPase
VAIVRISGPAARSIARALTGIDARPRYAELCSFREADGTRIDQGLLLVFPAPHSYTGEDVVELHGHGGRVVTDLLLARALALGARRALPGEFTFRAFLNDKLDLLQAEAVADLIDSGSAAAARAASRSLDGRFSADVAALQDALTELRARIEAWLDFPEEELRFDAGEDSARRLEALLDACDRLMVQANLGSVLRDGLSVVIAGPPNAGKSSLLNRLAGYEAAIVTDIAGTTRDALREHLSLGGLPISLVDTAGLRESRDPVEQEGLKRARAELGRADRVLWVVDVRDPPDAAIEAARTAVRREAVTLIRNKVDLTGASSGTDTLGGVPAVSLSALTGEGIDLLIAHLHGVAGLGGELGGAFSARRRHVEALARAGEHLRSARSELPSALELVAEELRGAQAALSELTGELSSDDLLGEIFSRFCIGK